MTINVPEAPAERRGSHTERWDTTSHRCLQWEATATGGRVKALANVSMQGSSSGFKSCDPPKEEVS